MVGVGYTKEKNAWIDWHGWVLYDRCGCFFGMCWALKSIMGWHSSLLFFRQHRDVLVSFTPSSRRLGPSELYCLANSTLRALSLASSRQCSISSQQYPAHQHPASILHMPSSIHQAYSKWSVSVPRLPVFSSSQDLPNERINLQAIHIIQFLQRLLNLPLVRLYIADKHQGIVLLNFLHRALGVERVDYDFVVI